MEFTLPEFRMRSSFPSATGHQLTRRYRKKIETTSLVMLQEVWSEDTSIAIQFPTFLSIRSSFSSSLLFSQNSWSWPPRLEHRHDRMGADPRLYHVALEVEIWQITWEMFGLEWFSSMLSSRCDGFRKATFALAMLCLSVQRSFTHSRRLVNEVMIRKSPSQRWDPDAPYPNWLRHIVRGCMVLPNLVKMNKFSRIQAPASRLHSRNP